MVRVSLAFGAVTALVQVLGLSTIGGVMALFQVGLLAGAPLALLLADALRSKAATVVVAAVISLALTAVATQVLIWFRQATPELIVISATIYGVALALLLASASASVTDGSAGRLDHNDGLGR